MAAAARVAKNRDLEADCVEIRMRATRRLGEMMSVQKDTLTEQGVDKNLAHQARVLDVMTEKDFEAKVADARSS